MDKLIRREIAHLRDDVFLRRLGGKVDGLDSKAHLHRSPILVAHVDVAGRIISYEHDGKTRLDTLLAQDAGCSPHLRPHRLGHLLAVENLSRARRCHGTT